MHEEFCEVALLSEQNPMQAAMSTTGASTHLGNNWKEKVHLPNRPLTKLLKLLNLTLVILLFIIIIILIQHFFIFSIKGVGIRCVTFFQLCAKVFWAAAVNLATCEAFFSLSVAVSQSLFAKGSTNLPTQIL